MRKINTLLILVFLVFGSIPVLAQSSGEPTKEEIAADKKAAKEEKQRLAKEKAEIKMAAKEEKQKAALEKVEAKREKNLAKARRNYDKALNNKHKAEVKLSKQNVKYEQAKLKGKTTGSDLAKLELAMKKTEIAIIKAEGDAANYQREIDRNLSAAEKDKKLKEKESKEN